MTKTIVTVLAILPIVAQLSGCAPKAAPEPEGQAQTGAAAKQPIAEQSMSSLQAFQKGQPGATGPLKDVYFDYDRSNIRQDARITLRQNAAWLRGNPSAKVEIEGHADERGTNEYNLALGARRAQAVKDYLVTLGSSSSRLSTISYGEELPVCREKSETCWQKNRRAHFVILTAQPTS